MKQVDFLRGMAAGLLTGAAIGFALAPKPKKKSKEKGPAGRIIKAVGDAVEYISDAMGF